MSEKKKVVIVTGGGTGGHLFPAIAICEIVKDQGFEPILITDSRCEKFVPKDLPFEYQIVDVQRRQESKTKFEFIKKYIKLLFSVIRMMIRKKSCLTVACGGYSSAPIVIASILTFTPFVLHEQNSVAGEANRVFSFFAKKIFLSFLHTIRFSQFVKRKIIWTGMPMQKRHKVKKIERELVDGKFSILVTGGSQGASFFDDVVIKAVKIFVKKHPEIDLEIFQQVRSGDIEKFEREYKEIGVTAEVTNFFHNIEEYYKKTNLFIGRSGATTLSEVIEYRLPGIFVPYPHAKDNHQYYNAKNIIEFKAGWVFEQDIVTPEYLADYLEKISTNKEKYINVIRALKKIKLDSKKIISREITKIIDKSS